MSSTSLVEIKGFASLMEKFDQLPKNLGGKLLRGACKVAMVPILEEAQRLAPQPSPGGPTGMIRDGLVIESRSVTKPAAQGVAGIQIRGPHRSIWHFTEFGVPSRGMGAKPFLRPAIRKKASESVRIMREEFRKAVLLACKKQDAIPPEIRSAKALMQVQKETRRALRSALFKLDRMKNPKAKGNGSRRRRRRSR